MRGQHQEGGGMTREEFEQYAKENGLVVWSKEMSEKAIKALEQEPTTKNDLGVDCISREATVKRLCNLAEYMNEHKENSGDPYIMAALFIQDNKTEFPSVTPQEPFINKPCVSSGVCEHDKNKVLDKIRAEIEQHRYGLVNDGLDIALNIIDKYKAETEEE